MTDCILSIDIGTTSLKAAFMTDKPGEVFVSREQFKNGTAGEWMPSLARAVQKLKSKNPDYAVEAICVSGNGPTIVSQDGKTLLHNASLSSEIEQEIKKLNTKSLFIPRLYAFKKMFPENWKNSKRIFSGPEYFLYEMTGRALTILPEERYVGAYWDENELLRCGKTCRSECNEESQKKDISLSLNMTDFFSKSDFEKLPPFVSPGSLAGKLNEKTALETGLLEGTLVFAGGPDFTVALIGTGTVFPGKMCDRAGSSEGINLCTENPVFADGLRTLPSVMPNLWNVSRLLEPNEDFGKAVDMIRTAAKNAGEYFPSFMIITGGQALDKNKILEKEKKSGMKIHPQYCADAELIGDLVLARVGLGDYDNIEEAVMVLG